MKKIIPAFAAVMFSFVTAACSPDAPPASESTQTPAAELAPASAPAVAVDPAHNSRNSLDWAGVYAGTIPAASGLGIDVTITLRNDSTYTVQYHYIDKQDGDFATDGVFQWDEEGGAITLDAKDIPPHYQVGENQLIQLDMEGNPITGELAEHYVLKKKL
ncbi:MAG: copper resistance protein NlpE [Azoarcus sp.]|nr:copper resistance protein NlpE [Azoarcus sp.]